MKKIKTKEDLLVYVGLHAKTVLKVSFNIIIARWINRIAFIPVLVALKQVSVQTSLMTKIVPDHRQNQ